MEGKLSRADLVRKLAHCRLSPKRQRIRIKESIIDELVSAIDFYSTPRPGNSKPRWRAALANSKAVKKACDLVILHMKIWGITPTEAERLLAHINGEIDFYQNLLGASAKKAWHNPARIFGRIILKAVQSSDEIDKRKIGTEFNAPMIKLIHELLGPVCALNKEKVPTLRAIHVVVVERAG